jgi:hypothetical protein
MVTVMANGDLQLQWPMVTETAMADGKGNSDGDEDG